MIVVYLTPEGYLKIASTYTVNLVNGVWVGTMNYSPEYNYFLRDHLGNTRAQLKPSGSTMAVVDTKNYYPFGQEHSPLRPSLYICSRCLAQV